MAPYIAMYSALPYNEGQTYAVSALLDLIDGSSARGEGSTGNGRQQGGESFPLIGNASHLDAAACLQLVKLVCKKTEATGTRSTLQTLERLAIVACHSVEMVQAIREYWASLKSQEDRALAMDFDERMTELFVKTLCDKRQTMESLVAAIPVAETTRIRHPNERLDTIIQASCALIERCFTTDYPMSNSKEHAALVLDCMSGLISIMFNVLSWQLKAHLKGATVADDGEPPLPTATVKHGRDMRAEGPPGRIPEAGPAPVDGGQKGENWRARTEGRCPRHGPMSGPCGDLTGPAPPCSPTWPSFRTNGTCQTYPPTGSPARSNATRRWPSLLAPPRPRDCTEEEHVKVLAMACKLLIHRRRGDADDSILGSILASLTADNSALVKQTVDVFFAQHQHQHHHSPDGAFMTRMFMFAVERSVDLTTLCKFALSLEPSSSSAGSSTASPAALVSFVQLSRGVLSRASKENNDPLVHRVLVPLLIPRLNEEERQAIGGLAQ